MATRHVSTIIVGEDITISLSSTLVPYCFGKFLEASEKFEIVSPQPCTALENIIAISRGVDHIVCLNNEGKVFTFGLDKDGRLGKPVSNFEELESVDEKDPYTNMPFELCDIPKIVQISCGSNFTVCVCENGFVYSFGVNEDGQLGLGNNEIYNTPKVISSLKDVEFIECGEDHTFCKTSNNEIFCWGKNRWGQLGLGNRDNQNTPILCSSLSNEDVIDIKCGSIHTLALTSNGDVLSCGNYIFGQLGREADTNKSSSFQKIEDFAKISRIECGNAHSLCIDIDNNLYVFGYNIQGQLGLSDFALRHKPIKNPSLSNIIDISKGGYSTFVKTSNNEIYAFGNNEFLQLGIKTENNNQITPIRVLEGREDIWFSKIKSKAKSARSILPRPSNEDDNSPPKKKQKINTCLK